MKKLIIFVLLIILPIGCAAQTGPDWTDIKGAPLIDARLHGMKTTATGAVNKAAIESALALGNVLLPPDGTYTIDNTTPISVATAGRIIMGRSNAILQVATQTQNCFLVTADDVTFENVSFAGAGGIYRGQEYRNTGDRPGFIKGTAVDNLTITKCSFDDPAITSVLFYGVTNSRISDCQFTSVATFSVSDDPTPGDYLGTLCHILLYGAANCRVSGNSISGNIGGIQANGNTSVETTLADGQGASEFTRQNVICDNTIFSGVTNCIYFSSINRDNIFRNNTMRSTLNETMHSIGNGAIIVGNNMRSDNASGVVTIRGSSDVVFSENIVESAATGSTGLYCYTSSSYPDPLHNLHISNNVFRHDSTGVNSGPAIKMYSFQIQATAPLVASAPARFMDISIVGNTLSNWGGSNTSGGTYEGIIDINQGYNETAGELVPRGLVIASNRIRGVYGSGYGVAGIRIQGGFFGCTITGNTIDGIGGGAAGAYYGMYLQCLSSSTISNNLIILAAIAGNNTYGISEALPLAYGAGTIGTVVATGTGNIYTSNNIFGTNNTTTTIKDGTLSNIYPKLSLYPTEITTAYTVSAWQNPSSLVIAPSGTCTVTPSVTASPWPLNHEMTIYNRAATATVTFESVSIAAGTNATFMQTATGTAANTWIKLK